MKEIYVKENDTGLKVFINGTPDIRQVPRELADAYIAGLERRIAEDVLNKK